MRPLLPEEHKAQETVQLVQLLVGMLVTFAALVLGLLTASAKTDFDTTTIPTCAASRRRSSNWITRCATTARNLTARVDRARSTRQYTAAAITSTWPLEPRPPGDFYPKVDPISVKDDNLARRALGDLLKWAQADVRLLHPADAYHEKLAQDSATRFDQLIALRRKLIEETKGSISYPFDRILVGWLLIIFLCFGLIAPRNALSLVTIMLGVLSIASAVLVILDLDIPFSGPIMVRSQPMWDALAYQTRS